MRKRRKITTMDTQERYFQNSLGHPSLPTAVFFLADPRALIRSISRGIACCSAAFFVPAKKGLVCGRLTSSFLAEAFRPTPVSRERSTAVSPAGPRSEGSSRKRSTAVSPFNPRAKRFVEKAFNRSPCNRARIDFHDCWACGRHPSGLWPTSFATARGFGPARLAWALLCSKRPLSTHHSQEPRDVR